MGARYHRPCSCFVSSYDGNDCIFFCLIILTPMRYQLTIYWQFVQGNVLWETHKKTNLQTGLCNC